MRTASLLFAVCAGCSLDPSGSGLERDASGDDTAVVDTGPVDGCSNGVKDIGEGDVDCGGICPQLCDVGRNCLKPSDCKSGYCDGKCTTPSCSNKRQDGDETDVDCGGGACPKCEAPLRCKLPTDCVSGSCDKGLCTAPTCADKVLNGGETDVDCGGGCPPCALGKQCAKGSDCDTGFCDATYCRHPRSCAALRGLTTSSGVWRIDPDGAGANPPFDAYCDMETDGGGWTFFAHVNESGSGTGLFTADVGTYLANRKDDGTTYSKAGAILPYLAHKEMMVSLDAPNPDLGRMALFSYPTSSPAFGGPIPCVGLDTTAITYRSHPTDPPRSAASASCSPTNWYLKDAVSGDYVVGFDALPLGNLSGKAMKGTSTWYHDGYWYVR